MTQETEAKSTAGQALEATTGAAQTMDGVLKEGVAMSLVEGQIAPGIEAVLEGNKLVLTIQLADADSAPYSTSGKTKILASTRGNAYFNGFSIGLNVFCKRAP
jgi:hypothetical protein